ncbi:hypothetical protein EK21DRAFT_118488 [Setomelanomma holmii]|uniref:Uncharacterized protein n=1 Tax=Setomelanomma holmii TaxID=210430 RepID=A0A9P4LGN0_9PLEO|nr:hypothetical protein EK21DRAFT_118488 [Setomelanomma holmii]
MSVAGASDGLNDVYEALERYSWDDDVEFQSGLSAILGTNSTPEQAAELALRARCFYYARKFNINIDFDGYKAYRNARGRPPPTPPTLNGSQPSLDMPSVPESGEGSGGIMPAPADANEPPAPYPTSFAHIVELITSGQPISGIKEIPNTVLAGQGTEPAKPRRKKPWEMDDADTATENAVHAPS